MTLQQCLGPSDGILQDYLKFGRSTGLPSCRASEFKEQQTDEANTRPMTAKKIIVMILPRRLSTTKINGKVCE